MGISGNITQLMSLNILIIKLRNRNCSITIIFILYFYSTGMIKFNWRFTSDIFEFIFFNQHIRFHTGCNGQVCLIFKVVAFNMSISFFLVDTKMPITDNIIEDFHLIILFQSYLMITVSIKGIVNNKRLGSFCI